MIEIRTLNPSLVNRQIEWYQEFHRHPELSMKEYRTTQRVKEILKENGIQPQKFPGEVGVIAVIEGKSPGPEVILRADIDALPIAEQSDLPFRSEIEGVAHMCGHDFHIAALLGAAVSLSESRYRWSGKVKLLFQPGEETTEGARYMIEHGALTGGEKAIFGLHNAPFLPAGMIGLREGPFFAAADTLHIQVKGLKGHAAMPHLTVDATVAASAIVMGLQTAVSRNVNPLHPAVVTIGSLQSGRGHNVISDLAEMQGTIRTFSKDTREKLYESIPRIVHDIAAGYGATVDLKIIPQTPAVCNDPALTKEFKKAALEILPPEKIVEAEPIMAAEDFAAFQELIPGCYFLVGTKDHSKNVVESWHHPKFQVNDSMISLATVLLIQAALSQLQ